MSPSSQETPPATFEAPEPSGADPSRSNLAAMRHFQSYPHGLRRFLFVRTFKRYKIHEVQFHGI